MWCMKLKRLEEALRNLTGALHEEFVFSGLATEEQWNESIAPQLRDMHLVIEGYEPGAPTARNYKYPHKSVWPEALKKLTPQEKPCCECTPTVRAPFAHSSGVMHCINCNKPIKPPQSQESLHEGIARVTDEVLKENGMSQQKPSWEEEFDEIFSETGIVGDRKFAEYLPFTYGAIKSFITRLVEQSYKEGRADEKVKPNSGDNCEVDWCSTCEVEYCNFHCRHNCAARTGEGRV